MTTFARPRIDAAFSESAPGPLSLALERLREAPLENLPADLLVGAQVGGDWWSRDELLHDHELARLQAGVARAMGTDDARVTGTFLLEGYAWQLVAPALALHLTTGHMPNLDARSLRVRLDHHGAITGVAYGDGRFATLAGRPDADHPDAVPLSCEEELLAWFRRSLVGHLEPVVALLSPRIRRGRRALWASVEDCCSGALSWIGDQLDAGDAARARADVLLGQEAPLSGSARYRTIGEGPEAVVVRERVGCCQSFRRPDGALCSTCPRARAG